MRPIEIEDAFLRLAETTVAQLFLAGARDIVSNHQFGVEQGGGEALRKLFFASLAVHPAQGLLALDASNAFGSLDRAFAWDQFSHTPSLASSRGHDLL